MKKLDLERHKFDTKWKFMTFLVLLVFAGFLQVLNAPMANEFIAVLIGLAGRELLPKGLSPE